MTQLLRRRLLQLALAAPAATLAMRPSMGAGVESAPPGVDASALHVGADWQRLFSAATGASFAWWYAGTVYAHVDGLREFPIVTFHAVVVCRAGRDRGAATVDWRTFGFFGDLERGGHASSWDNPFTAARCAIPPRFSEGPGQYRLEHNGDSPTLSMQAHNVRVNRCSVSSTVAEGLVSLTQIEGTLQGLPQLNGTLPALDSPRITERQTRLQLVARVDALADPVARPPTIRGFFNHVYDALPDWLGFGDRLGSALSKGVMRKASLGEIVDRATWEQLRRVHPEAFAAGELRALR
jgi:hypothetical protein